MTITFEQLKDILDKEGLKYFEDSRESRILLGMGGMHGRFEIMISLIDSGAFLQFRTLRYLECRPGHENVPAMLKVITELNLRMRLVKFCWDAGDGEVLAYADMWLVDNTLTQKQFSRMMSNLMPAIDLNVRRLRETIETGQDPGPVTPEQAARDALAAGGGGLPPALRAALEKIQEKKGGAKKDDEEVDDLDTI